MTVKMYSFVDQVSEPFTHTRVKGWGCGAEHPSGNPALAVMLGGNLQSIGGVVKSLKGYEVKVREGEVELRTLYNSEPPLMHSSPNALPNIAPVIIDRGIKTKRGWGRVGGGIEDAGMLRVIYAVLRYFEIIERIPTYYCAQHVAKVKEVSDWQKADISAFGDMGLNAAPGTYTLSDTQHVIWVSKNPPISEGACLNRYRFTIH
jgi:hypothetical protein